MKKKIMIMVAAALIGLVGCGSEPQVNENIPTSTEKIEEVVAASTETPATTETCYKTIEVTEENWDIFFELVEEPVWKENAFGEGELKTIYYRIALREEYKPFVLSADVAFGFESHKVPRVIEIDGPNFTYTITDEILFEGWTDECTTKFTLETEKLDSYAAKCKVYKEEELGVYCVDYADEILLTRVRGSMDVFYEKENENLFETTEKDEEEVADLAATTAPTATPTPVPDEENVDVEPTPVLEVNEKYGIPTIWVEATVRAAEYADYDISTDTYGPTTYGLHVTWDTADYGAGVYTKYLHITKEEYEVAINCTTAKILIPAKSNGTPILITPSAWEIYEYEFITE